MKEEGGSLSVSERIVGRVVRVWVYGEWSVIRIWRGWRVWKGWRVWVYKVYEEDGEYECEVYEDFGEDGEVWRVWVYKVYEEDGEDKEYGEYECIKCMKIMESRRIWEYGEDEVYGE